MPNFSLNQLVSGLCAALLTASAVAAPDGIEVFPLGDAAPAEQAQAPAVRHTLLVTALPVQSPMQIPDLPYFSQQLQQELVRRLEPGFQPRASSTEAVIVFEQGRPETPADASWIRDLARRHSVRFVVGGIIRDVGFEGESYRLGLGGEIRPGERKRELGLPLLDFTRLGIKSAPSARRLEIDLLVFDGISGAQVGRHRIGGRVDGDVVFGGMAQAPDSGIGQWLDSDFGRLIDAALNDAVGKISQDTH